VAIETAQGPVTADGVVLDPGSLPAERRRRLTGAISAAALSVPFLVFAGATFATDPRATATRADELQAIWSMTLLAGAVVTFSVLATVRALRTTRPLTTLRGAVPVPVRVALVGTARHNGSLADALDRQSAFRWPGPRFENDVVVLTARDGGGPTPPASAFAVRGPVGHAGLRAGQAAVLYLAPESTGHAPAPGGPAGIDYGGWVWRPGAPHGAPVAGGRTLWFR
jgi:hypothetical protein